MFSAVIFQNRRLIGQKVVINAHLGRTRAGRKVNQAAVSAARPELEAERQQMSTAQLTRLSLQKGGKTLSPGMTLKDNGLHTGLVLM